ncbi:MAG: hypothetical protein HY940_08775 [Gammaproteobacteria bacterium]|nr:hypothetical protein [Gammaproteobacteria bacterium]
MVALGILPGTGHALGLGEIELHSALNQPFNADVELLATNPAEAETIKVSIASAADFDKAGLEPLPVLSELQFQVDVRNGVPYIKISSSAPIQEPFLDFLLEVDWSSGHLVREYTVLLDLPIVSDEAPAAIEAPLSAAPSAPVDEPGNEPAEMMAAPSELTPEEQAAGPQPSAATSQPRQLPGEGRRGDNELYYGRVKRDDTLWNIAKALRPESATVPQVMMALLKSNPEAFINNNVNELKADYVLRIPDPALIQAMSAAEADRESRLHYERWLDIKQQRAGQAGVRPLGADQSGTVSGQPPARAQQGGARLKLVVPEAKDVPQPPAATVAAGENFQQEDLEVVRKQLQMAIEATDISRQENTALRDRISQLEGQLAKMERLLSMRADTLTALQQQGQQAEAGQSQTEPSQAEATAEQENNQIAVPPPQQVTPTPPVRVTPLPAEPVAVEEPGVLVSIVETVLGLASSLNTMMLGAIAAVVLVIGGGLVMIRKRRQAALEDFATMQHEEHDQGPASAGASQDVDALDGMTTPSSQGVPVEIGSEIDEIDVLAEADVYIAYHRFDRAEELLKEALGQDPQRQDIAGKLLEVYAAAGKREEFVAGAEKLHQESGGAGAIWDQVANAGMRIAPDHPLFSGAAQKVQMARAPLVDDAALSDTGGRIDLPGGDLDSDLGKELDDLEMSLDSSGLLGGLGDSSAPQEPTIPADAAPLRNEPMTGPAMESDIGLPAGDEHALEFDLASSTAAEPDAAVVELPRADAGTGGGLEFIVEQAPADVVEVPSTGTATAHEEPALSNTMEFDTVGVEESPASGSSSDSGMADALSELMSMVDDKEAPGGAADQGLSQDLELAAAGVADNQQPSDPLLGTLDDEIDWLSATSEDEDVAGSTLFSSEDEIATKLDLARAYIDMGDQESAGNILQEITRDGNDEQKKEAQQLLAQIG